MIALALALALALAWPLTLPNRMKAHLTRTYTRQ